MKIMEVMKIRVDRKIDANSVDLVVSKTDSTTK